MCPARRDKLRNTPQRQMQCVVQIVHLSLFIFQGSDVIINVLLIFKGVNEIASLVTHVLLIFKGVRELKVRQIDHTIYFRA
jgi:hypothetical protein